MRGHPKISIRLHPEALRRLKAMAQAERGRRSGVGQLIRKLVYQKLDFDSGEWEATHPEPEPD